MSEHEWTWVHVHVHEWTWNCNSWLCQFLTYVTDELKNIAHVFPQEFWISSFALYLLKIIYFKDRHNYLCTNFNTTDCYRSNVILIDKLLKDSVFIMGWYLCKSGWHKIAIFKNWIPTFGKHPLILLTYCNGPKAMFKLLKISYVKILFLVSLLFVAVINPYSVFLNF